jgi:hypothetical protein
MSYSLIRSWTLQRTASLSLLCLVVANPIPLTSLGAALPDMRPILVGSGPDSLINLIDCKGLIQHGQSHGAIRIVAYVRPNGSTVASRVYGGTPGTDLLRFEVRKCLRRTQFIPAVYNRQRVYAFFYGTVVFGAIDGKPRLRIFANQEQSELEKESDFIQPQSFEIPNHYYEPQKYPDKSWWDDDTGTVVVVKETIDATGKVKDLQIEREIPSGSGRSETALKVIHEATFFPGFRNGRPVDSVTHVNFIFIPPYWNLK